MRPAIRRIAPIVLASLALLAGCRVARTPKAAAPASTATLFATAGATLAPRATASPAPATIALAASPAPTATPLPATATPPTVTPAPSSAPVALDLQAPLLIDSKGGRLYVQATDEAGQALTAVLAASDGHVLGTFPVAGPMALDAARGSLFVDRGNDGVWFLDAATGQVQQTVPLPAAAAPLTTPAAPQADPVNGQVFVMRGNSAYMLSAVTGAVLEVIPVTVTPQDNCQTPHDRALPIVGSHFDAGRRVLYLDFVSYACTPWIGLTTVAYDVFHGVELGRLSSYPFQATVADGMFYSASAHRFGIGYLTAWRAGEPARQLADLLPSGSAPQLDTRRGRLYQSVAGSLNVYEAASLRLLFTVPQPQPGQLAGYDPATDQLYFLHEGKLRRQPAAAVQPAAAQAPAAVEPPAQPVSQLVAARAETRGRALWGVWGDAVPEAGCYIFNQAGGLLLASGSDGAGWQRPFSGLPACATVTALTLSPDYTRDRTAFVAVAGMGIFRSTDGGASWQPASSGLASMGVTQILPSSGLAADRTLFARAVSGGLLRTTDNGDTWRTLPLTPTLAALSPEFGQDHTVLAVTLPPDGSRPVLQRSGDGGQTWQAAGTWPESADPVLLSPAPLLARYHVLFAVSTNGAVHRSADGGTTWQRVLQSGVTTVTDAQIAYADQPESGRPVFLVVRSQWNPGDAQGRLYRSRDGGQSWEELALPGDGVPMALAISPDFSQDRALYVGLANGQVLRADGLALPVRSRP